MCRRPLRNQETHQTYDLRFQFDQYGPVTMIVPASGHQVLCIPWVQMGTFNKEIGFLCGLKKIHCIYFVGNTYNPVYIWCCKYGENCYCERCASKQWCASKHTGLLNSCLGKWHVLPYSEVPLISARVPPMSGHPIDAWVYSEPCSARSSWMYIGLVFLVSFFVGHHSGLALTADILDDNWHSRGFGSLCSLSLASPSSIPIALTSCLCKVLGRIINTRFIWYLEKSGMPLHGDSRQWVSSLTWRKPMRQPGTMVLSGTFTGLVSEADCLFLYHNISGIAESESELGPHSMTNSTLDTRLMSRPFVLHGYDLAICFMGTPRAHRH